MIWRYVASFTIVGVLLPLLIASTAVAARYWVAGYDVGEPLIGPWFYHPLLVWQWAFGWGFEEAHRPLFVQGLLLAFVPTVIAGGSLGLRAAVDAQQRGRATDAAGSMGTAGELLRSGGIATHGDGVVLGKAGRTIVRDVSDKHVLMLGPSGSGKSVALICTLLDYSGSAVVHDPKGELALITSRFRASLGPCHVFDPTTRHASKFNPLLEIRQGEHLVGDCQTVARLLVYASGQGSPELEKDPFWDEMGAQLLCAMVMQVCLSKDRTLSHLYATAVGLESGKYPKPATKDIKEVFDGHKNREDRVRNNITTTVMSKLHWLIDPIVREVTSRSDFRAGDPFTGDRPTTVYISCPPAQQERLRPLMRLVQEMIENAPMNDHRHLTDGRLRTRRVLFPTDEFPIMKYQRTKELGVDAGRGRGIRYMLVAQDLTQIEKHYSSKQSITANVGTIVIMPGFSGDLRKIEEWGGWTMKPLRSRGRQILRPLSAHSEEHEARMPVLNPAEMLANEKQALVLHLGCPRPVWLDRVRYFEERRYAGRWDTV